MAKHRMASHLTSRLLTALSHTADYLGPPHGSSPRLPSRPSSWPFTPALAPDYFRAPVVALAPPIVAAFVPTLIAALVATLIEALIVALIAALTVALLMALSALRPHYCSLAWRACSKKNLFSVLMRLKPVPSELSTFNH